MLTENQREWFDDLIVGAIDAERSALADERLWANAGGDSAPLHEANAKEIDGYIQFLTKLHEEYAK